MSALDVAPLLVRFRLRSLWNGFWCGPGRSLRLGWLLVLLAPAARSDLFHREIARHPERFEHLRTFTMADRYESQDRLAGPIYTRSLLYLISGALEDGDDVPVVGMERYLSGAPPHDEAALVDIRAFLLPAQGPRLVLSRTDQLAPGAGAGFRSNSTKHGDFDDDPDTRASLTAIIAE